MAFDILKIKRIKTAHNEATIPIKEITLFSLEMSEKSSCVILNTIKPKAKTIKIYVKIFMRN